MSIRRFNIIDNVIYVVSSAGIHFLQSDTGEILESLDKASSPSAIQNILKKFLSPSEIPKYLESDKLVTNDLEFKNGEARNPSTGEILWTVDKDILSNVVFTQSEVFLLTNDHKFLILNPQNGKEIASVQFEPISKSANSVHTNALANSFYVAVDKDENLSYVFLGDSAQLFAFELSE